mmetsp:Transcript_15010/g.47083  ORF Transcript_15010/g.47083 Transcript_15010/m.47083 type:complete len:243 (-) Transcript_15010:252-980(-)
MQLDALSSFRRVRPFLPRAKAMSSDASSVVHVPQSPSRSFSSKVLPEARVASVNSPGYLVSTALITQSCAPRRARRSPKMRTVSWLLDPTGSSGSFATDMRTPNSSSSFLRKRPALPTTRPTTSRGTETAVQLPAASSSSALRRPRCCANSGLRYLLTQERCSREPLIFTNSAPRTSSISQPATLPILNSVLPPRPMRKGTSLPMTCKVSTPWSAPSERCLFLWPDFSLPCTPLLLLLLPEE